jgi:hypothetical protein
MLNSKNIFLIIIKKLFIALVFALAATAVIYFLQGQITGIGKSIVQKKKLSAIFAKREEMRSQMAKDLESVQDHSTQINDAVLPTDNVLEFVSALDTVAAQNSIKYTIGFGTPVAVSILPGGSNLYAVDISLNLTANAFTLANFLRDYDKMPYFASANIINIVAPSAAGWDDPSTVSIQGKVYTK